jgi:CRP-like cAMP-binding protein
MKASFMDSCNVYQEAQVPETNVIQLGPPLAESFARGNHLLAGLPADDFDLLSPHLHETFLEPGRHLQEPGRIIDRVYFPRGGLISLTAGNGRAGHPIDTASIGCEGAIGLMAGLGSHIAKSGAVVQMPGRALYIAPEPFAEAAAASAPLRQMIVLYNDALLAQVQRVLVCNTAHRFEERLCRWLVQASDRVGDTVVLTQEHLAGILGVQRTTVTMICRRLQADGILNVRRGRIVIRDPAVLEGKACDCVRHTRRLAEPAEPCIVSH